jgi:hypothetical protein
VATVAYARSAAPEGSGGEFHTEIASRLGSYMRFKQVAEPSGARMLHGVR